MKIALNVISILGLGIILGLLFRPSKPARSPGAAEAFTNDSVTFTDDGRPVVDTHAPIENPDPIKPAEEEAWLSQFELTERSGRTVASEDLLGEPYIVSFFFTTCPSICVQQNQKLKELQDEFAGRGIKFLAITVDPETDTLPRLNEYATRFAADKDQWLFLTGDLTYIRRVGAEIFQQPVAKQFHTERFALVDAEGKIEGFYSWPEKRQMKKLVEQIESMLSSSPAAPRTTES